MRAGELGRSLIRIADYTEKYDHLKNFRRDDEAEDEFDQICEQIFGATIDDINDEDYERLFGFHGDLSEKLTIDYSRSLGYDLLIRDRVRVSDWKSFAAMIVAQNEGLLPKTPEERAARRLEAEAAEYLEGDQPIRG
jgi:hypothetical protein